MAQVGLRVAGIEKHFGGNKVLVGIDLDVPAGTMVGFVGPNGSGKTTLLNIISGFVESDSGTVRLGDVDITGTPTHKVAALGLARTFQVPRLVDRSEEHTSELQSLMRISYAVFCLTK